ncbi:uncharacterized protein LOC105702380 [Orussus abietinus]|uniref:uncharacterized protein LOC105702380 n=1 Tax=Orussus abietinus TaxID=222816 RepID=UPI0006254AD7|nr:uncharacterized protein LOC105702380 [Orussus abietinus]
MSENNISMSSMDGVETHSVAEVKKRRSSIYKRRSITHTIKDTNAVTSVDHDEKSEDCERIDNIAKRKEDESVELKKYIDKLRCERKNWQETLSERRRQRRTLLKKKAQLEHSKRFVDLSKLSDSERTWISHRPNYEQICRNSKKLVIMAVRVSILNQYITKLIHRFLLNMNQKIDNATKRIIELVD